MQAFNDRKIQASTESSSQSNLPNCTFFIKDLNGIYLGPFTIQVLAYFAQNQFISSETVLVPHPQNVELTYSSLDTSFAIPPEKKPECFSWSSSIIFFPNLNSKITKCFLGTTLRSQKNDKNSLSISSPQLIVNFGFIHDFETFLEQQPKLTPFIEKADINPFAKLFAQWVKKCFDDLHLNVSENEFLDFLLEPNYDIVSTFIKKRVEDESACRRFINAFTQWRIHIPVFRQSDPVVEEIENCISKQMFRTSVSHNLFPF